MQFSAAAGGPDAEQLAGAAQVVQVVCIPHFIIYIHLTKLSADVQASGDSADIWMLNAQLSSWLLS